MDLIEKNIECPYCGETLGVLIDMSETGQSYVEDCQVCCRPIVFAVEDDGSSGARVNVRAENE